VLKNPSFARVLVLFSVVLLTPAFVCAQQIDDSAAAALPAVPELVLAQQAGQPSNVPAPAQQAESAVERTVRRFRIGVEGGVALDPELIMFGAHGSFGPIFNQNVEFRPGFEFGVGEITTTFGINLDVLYTLPGATRTTRWTPYVGVGPNFGLSHRGFDASEDENSESPDNRFDFSDTDFEGGVNFIAGVRSQRGLFFEMKATAYGVSAVRLLAGFNF
jgi:hypothetical protein